MWLILCGLLTILFFKYFLFSRIVQFVVFRLIKSKISIGRIGLFACYDVKIDIFDKATIELDKIWISSSFVNPDLSKPLAVCVGDLRVESAWLRREEAGSSTSPRPAKHLDSESTNTRRSFVAAGIENVIRKACNILQYVSLSISNINAVLLEAGLPGCLLHLSVEEILLDSFRDRQSMRCELSCQLLSGKLFRRTMQDSPGGQRCLMEFTLESTTSLHVDLKSARFSCLSISVNKPVLTISEGLPKLVQQWNLRNPLPPKRQESFFSDNVRDPERLSALRRFLPPEWRLQLSGFWAKLTSSDLEKERSLVVEMNAFDFGLISETSTGDQSVSCDLLNFAIKDTHNLVTNISMMHFYAKLTSDLNEITIECNEPALVAREDTAMWLNQVLFLDHIATKWNQRNSKSAPAKPSSPSSLHLKVEFNAGHVCYLPVSNMLACLNGSYQFCSMELSRTAVFDPEGGAETFLEFGLEHLAVSVNELVDYGRPTISQDDVHRWSTVLYLSAVLLDANFTKAERKVQFGFEKAQVEWNPLISALFKHLKMTIKWMKQKYYDVPKEPKQPDMKPEKENVAPSNDNSGLIGVHQIELLVSFVDIALFAPIMEKECIFARCQRFKLEKTASLIGCTASGAAVCLMTDFQQKIAQDQFLLADLMDSSFVSDQALGFNPLFVLENLKVFKLTTNQEANVEISGSALVGWSCRTHLICKSLVDDLRGCFSVVGEAKISGEKKAIKSWNFQVTFKDGLDVSLDLPRDHRISMNLPWLRCMMIGKHFGLETSEFLVTCDGHDIVTVKDPSLRYISAHPHVQTSRSSYPELKTPQNKTWHFNCKLMQFVFPYNYDFSAAYSELINIVKWVKLVHGVERKPFTARSSLPADLYIVIDHMTFDLHDDPFEVRLQHNYELMVDEQYETERRRQMLESKVETLQRENYLISSSKIEELRRSLQMKNSSIYIQRSKKLCESEPIRTQLFVVSMKSLQIKAIADISLHGRENVLTIMNFIDNQSPPPDPSLNFSTMWCRMVEMDFDELSMHMRDYPQPYFSVRDGHVWGKLAGVEIDGNERAKRSVIIDVAEPWGKFIIHRNMSPLKFYYDLNFECDAFRQAYGPCWEPCLAMIAQCFELINQTSRDPSPVLPFWDKIRLLFHGSFGMSCKQLTTIMLASPDPYNTTEQAEIIWSDFGFEWSNGVFIVKADVDAYIRTASKYDDLRIFHLPSLKLIAKMLWNCLGNPFDHNSTSPCAPDKIPEFSVNKDHDSYRAFRSQNLSLVLSLEVAASEFFTDTTCPQLLLYSNTFRWLDNMKNTLAAVNRPVKRGTLFKKRRPKKLQLTRHFKTVKLSLTLPRFLISYWMSFSSNHGFRLIGQSFQLSSAHTLTLLPNCGLLGGGKGEGKKRENEEDLIRRQGVCWSTNFMNAELADVDIYLFSEKSANHNFCDPDANRNFFMSISRLAYAREGHDFTAAMFDRDTPTHKLVLYDLRGAWTKANQQVVLAILDGVQRSNVLRQNLSTDALKDVQITGDGSNKTPRQSYISTVGGSTTSSASPINTGLHVGGHHQQQQQKDGDQAAAALLNQLIIESASKFTAYAEDVDASEMPTEQLNGVALCEEDDVLFKSWQFELINGQLVLQGCESTGYVLCCAARAEIASCQRMPVWKENQLLGKTTWKTAFQGIQYYATLFDASSNTINNVQWLPKEVIVGRDSRTSSNNVVETVVGLGESAGGVLTDVSRKLDADDAQALDFPPQLQRIISRCSCHLYFCHFSDNLDPMLLNFAPPVNLDEGHNLWHSKEYVDCFTVKHNSLIGCTNSDQYDMIIDIVNNLVLIVDPKKKEYAEKLQRLRFKVRLQSQDDIRPQILALQNEVRDRQATLRYLERQVYHLSKQLQDNNDQEKELMRAELDEKVEKAKREVMQRSDDLAMHISCFKQKQFQAAWQSHIGSKVISDPQHQAGIARRFEVCFEDAQWRLTETDGQLGLADMQIRNFLYTRVARINNAGEHLLEVGHVKIENLLPNSPYRDVLQPQKVSSRLASDRQLAVRVICREMAPVGGISVKEHFEVNVVPMTIQLTHAFYTAMMRYFFPNRNIDTGDATSQQLGGVQGALAGGSELNAAGGSFEGGWEESGSLAGGGSGTSTGLAGRGPLGLSNNAGVGSEEQGKEKGKTSKLKGAVRKKQKPIEELDDIDKMKKRAAQNNSFLYIKIPEVAFTVSYKGSKEKNIEDVSNFHFVFPDIEFHDRNWTWLDFAIELKKHSKRSLLQQFMKNQFMRNVLKKGGRAVSSRLDQEDISALPEEEKARLLLGTKLMGTPEKSNKSSSFFHKYSK